MKKSVFFAMAVLAVLSCYKEEVKVSNENEPLQFVFTVADKPSFDAQTKGPKTSWVDGDKIYIVLDDEVPTTMDHFMILEYKSSEWTVSQESTVSPKTEGGTLDALYYEKSDVTGSYYESDGYGIFRFNDEILTYGHYMYLVGNNIDYTVKDGKVEASISLEFDKNEVRTYTQFRITGIEGDWAFYTVDNDVADLTCEAPVWQEYNKNFNTEGYAFGFMDMIACEDGMYMYYSIYHNSEEFTVTLKKKSGKNAGIYQKTFPKKISGYTAAITFKGPQFDESGACTNGWKPLDIDYDGDISGHAYVDLGGNSYWATMNLGASQATALGDYYAWGEIEPYYSSMNPLAWKDEKTDGYNYSTYKFWESVTADTGKMTKYTNSTGDLTVLESADDAATQNWGAGWRIPTDEDFKWLMDKCTFELLDMGVYKVTSTINNKFIYLPIAQVFQGVNLKSVNSYCSSKLSTTDTNLYFLGFGLSPTERALINRPRVYGFQIRPVATKP